VVLRLESKFQVNCMVRGEKCACECTPDSVQILTVMTYIIGFLSEIYLWFDQSL
jgi:hypothetical protein